MREHISDDFDPYEHLYDEPGRMRGRPREGGPRPARRGRLTEEARELLAGQREDELASELPDGADRWSTWDDGEQGPNPRPDWLITERAAVDYEMGVLKTGKEADVHLVRRELPGTDRHCLLAAKRYRSSDHRQFHRDAGYLEGRRVRRSRELRAIQNRTVFGRNLIAEQWAAAEFAALGRLWSAGAPVPYPAQRVGTEVVLEFIGERDGTAAPRLLQVRPDAEELAELWHQLLDAMRLLASLGLTHGDLSPYNLLVHNGQVVLIDLPQVVDLVANPRGMAFLERDVRNVVDWFTARGLAIDAGEVLRDLLDAAGLSG